MKNILLRFYKSNKREIHGTKYAHKEENIKKIQQYSELTLYYLEITRRKEGEKSTNILEKSHKNTEKSEISRGNINNKYYKLGVTHNIEKRLESLGINKDYNVRVCFIIKSKCVIRLFLLEQFIQHKYKHFREPRARYIISNGTSELYGKDILRAGGRDGEEYFIFKSEW